MSNYATLNLDSDLVIKRYALQNPEAVAHWEKRLRKLIRVLPVDAVQKERYKETLLQAWKVN